MRFEHRNYLFPHLPLLCNCWSMGAFQRKSVCPYSNVFQTVQFRFLKDFLREKWKKKSECFPSGVKRVIFFSRRRPDAWKSEAVRNSIFKSKKMTLAFIHKAANNLPRLNNFSTAGNRKGKKFDRIRSLFHKFLYLMAWSSVLILWKCRHKMMHLNMGDLMGK